MNHTPAAIAICAPSTAVARLALSSRMSPPATATTPGSSDSQKRPAVMWKLESGPTVKLNEGPTNGTIAPQAPRSTTSGR